jgi:penicillin-binding protein 1A
MPSMVLGTSDVRLIDMTRAFAAVSAKGASVEPYGITKVTSVDGAVLYTRPQQQGQVLVPPYVAAGITDLLQTAVNIGTGRAAQIGRPVAGKTGTTSSNKDGWFLGFSSGITTGVWMGRDDAKPVAGLQGGHAPARAFAAYMKVAVAKRPVEKFDTELQLPEWQLEPDDETLSGDPNSYFYTDEQGNLIDPRADKDSGPGGIPPEMYEDGAAPREAPPAANDDFLNQATGGSPADQPVRRPAQRGALPTGDTPRSRPTPRPYGE